MKLFKNRGDIYMSKSDMKADLEQRVLLVLLVCLLIFTVVFVIFIGAKYDFSAKKFFAPEEIRVSDSGQDTKELPDVEGKDNYLLLVTNKSKTDVYLSVLVQFDMDSVSYKVCNLLPDTRLNGTPLSQIYANGGMNNTVLAVEESLFVQVDYYLVMTAKDFAEFANAFGKVHYPLAESVKYRQAETEDPYSLRLKSGEETLDGKRLCAYLRYLVQEKKDCRAANDLALHALNQLINTENAEKKDDLFKKCISLSTTNITMKDFSEKSDIITVLSDETTGVNSYNVEAVYADNKITANALGDIKSYFAK